MFSPESRRGRRRETQDALRRADVIAAASAVFARKGFHDAQVAEIAAQAELSLKTVYALFSGKEAIYEEVVSSTAERMRSVVRERVDAAADPLERVLVLIDTLFCCFEENRDLLQIYVRSTQGLPWRLRQNMGQSAHEIFHSFTSWVASLMQDALGSMSAAGRGAPNAQSLAWCLIGAVTTTATFWLETRPDEPLTRAAPGVRAVFAPLLERRQ
jgi:AcrR family transcriptional regulator